jgi:two-component system LytT family sensor kinase
VNVRPDNPNERQADGGIHGAFATSADSRNVALRRITIIVVTLFWVGQFGANTLYTQLTSPEAALETLVPRALVCVAGEIISLGCIALQNRWRSSRLSVRAYWAVGFTIISSLLLGIANLLIFEAFLGPMGTSPYWERFWGNYPMQVIPRLWVFGAVYAMALAISYSADVREREEEIAALRGLAQDAQLRALRSQLQPHFLFNALNSIAALIREGRAQQAEDTTEHLADFLRITLSLDPQRLITVAEETLLQRIYLDILKVRFPTRLNVVFDIPTDVERALVPNLILQPLVENSIKHAVARSTATVTVQVRARAVGEELRIIVEDDGGNSACSSSTTSSLRSAACRDCWSRSRGWRSSERSTARAKLSQRSSSFTRTWCCSI